MRGPQQRAGSDISIYIYIYIYMMRAALMHVCMHIYAYVIILCFLAALDSTSFQAQLPIGLTAMKFLFALVLLGGLHTYSLVPGLPAFKFH